MTREVNGAESRHGGRRRPIPFVGNLWPTIRAVRDTAGKAVLEVGVGTGRVTRVLARESPAVYVFDVAPAMFRDRARCFQHTAR